MRCIAQDELLINKRDGRFTPLREGSQTTNEREGQMAEVAKIHDEN